MNRSNLALNWNIPLREVFDVAVKWLFGTVSGVLMTFGTGLLLTGIPGFLDYVGYGLELLFDKSTSQPGPAFQWPQYLGLIFFVIGVLVKCRHYKKDQIVLLREEKTVFKESWRDLSDERLQDEFERLYGVKCASVSAIKNILNHPDNKNLAIALFEKAHLNIEPREHWFVTKGRFMKFRYNLYIVFWVGLLILAIATLIMAGLEYYFSVVTQSGKYAIYPYCVLFIAMLVALYTNLQDLQSLGHALELVHKLRP